MNKLPFAIGILSWKGYDSLENSLFSYKKYGLSNMTDQKFVCLPEYSDEGIKIAEKYNYKPILVEKNLGILGGFKLLAENMPQGPILLLENDLELIENKKETFLQLQKSLFKSFKMPELSSLSDIGSILFLSCIMVVFFQIVQKKAVQKNTKRCKKVQKSTRKIELKSTNSKLPKTFPCV